MPLLWLALAFAALVVVSGRWKGARALVGLGMSLAIVVGFVVPAILDGRSPEGVALVGALAIMLVTIPLAQGAGPTAVAAGSDRSSGQSSYSPIAVETATSPSASRNRRPASEWRTAPSVSAASYGLDRARGDERARGEEDDRAPRRQVGVVGDR